GVTCSAPNCTVSPMPASKAMMRPVILSRPENMADLLAIFCAGGSGRTSSPGCGEVSAGCGGPGGWRWAGSGTTAPAGPAGRGQRVRLHAAGRGLPRLPRVWLIRILLLLLGIALVWIALVGIALILVLRIRLLRAAARHARRWPWRRPKQGFERVEELRSGR